MSFLANYLLSPSFGSVLYNTNSRTFDLQKVLRGVNIGKWPNIVPGTLQMLNYCFKSEIHKQVNQEVAKIGMQHSNWITILAELS